MALLLFYGDNRLELGEAVREVRRAFNLADVITFDGRDVPLPALSAACRTAGLFDPERLIIVQDLHERLKGARKGYDQAEIEAILAEAAPTTSLLLACHGMPGNHALIGLVRGAGGEPRGFATPKARDLPAWIASRATKHGAMIGRPAASLLVDLIGENVMLLDNELEKLATYAVPETVITPEMVETLVGAVTQASIFALVDAVAAGQPATALRLLHEQLEHTGSGAMDVALHLIRLFARQVRILLRVRLAQEARRSKSQIISDLTLPPYYADRYFRQAERMPRAKLQRSFEQLAAFEYGLKSGRIDAATGLDLLVADLCA
jgi:DNA polymerase-3 subunit delta